MGGDGDAEEMKMHLVIPIEVIAIPRAFGGMVG